MTARTVAAARRPAVVALGGGHGLHASLSALRLLTDRPHRGRHRRRRRRLVRPDPARARRCCRPATCGWRWPRWPATTSPVTAVGRRCCSTGSAAPGALAGHPVGNLLLTGLLERDRRPGRRARPRSAELVGAVGRVLPMSPVPLDLVAEVDRLRPDDPTRDPARSAARSSIAATPGRVRSVRLLPRRRAGLRRRRSTRCARPTVVVLGPGLVVHQRASRTCWCRELGRGARRRRGARVVVTLNLVPQAGETDGLLARRAICDVLCAHAPDLRIDACRRAIADADSGRRRQDLARRSRAASAPRLVSSSASPRDDGASPARPAAAGRGVPQRVRDADGDRSRQATRGGTRWR